MTQHLSRVRGIARRMTRLRPREFDEAYSVAVAGLAEAIRTFDPERQPSLTKHINAVVGHRVLDYLRSAQTRRERMTFPQSDPVAGEAMRRMVDPAPPVGWATDYEDTVVQLSRRLPSRHGEVIRARYLHADAAGPEGAAVRLGLKIARSVQLHREAIAMLRDSTRKAVAS